MMGKLCSSITGRTALTQWRRSSWINTSLKRTICSITLRNSMWIDLKRKWTTKRWRSTWKKMKLAMIQSWTFLVLVIIWVLFLKRVGLSWRNMLRKNWAKTSIKNCLKDCRIWFTSKAWFNPEKQLDALQHKVSVSRQLKWL